VVEDGSAGAPHCPAGNAKAASSTSNPPQVGLVAQKDLR
jgi:hypothetical protein